MFLTLQMNSAEGSNRPRGNLNPANADNLGNQDTPQNSIILRVNQKKYSNQRVA